MFGLVSDSGPHVIQDEPGNSGSVALEPSHMQLVVYCPPAHVEYISNQTDTRMTVLVNVEAFTSNMLAQAIQQVCLPFSC